MNEDASVPAGYRSELFTPPGSLWVIPAELLTAGFIGLLFIILIVRMRSVPALAGLALGLGVLVAVSLGRTVGSNTNEVTGYVVIGLALFLATVLLLSISRLVIWWGREAWWVSLGSSVISSLLLTLVLLALNVAAGALGVPTEVGYWAVYSLPVLSLGLTVWGLLRRRRKIPSLLP